MSEGVLGARRDLGGDDEVEGGNPDGDGRHHAQHAVDVGAGGADHHHLAGPGQMGEGEDRADQDPESQAKPVKPHWFRLGSDLVLVASASDDGRRLQGLRIYRRDTARNLTEEVTAPAAVAQPGGWRLQGAVISKVVQDRSVVSAPTDQDWRTTLTPGGVVRLFRAGEDISTSAALKALRGSAPMDRSPGFYQTRLLRTFAEPLATLVMLLLSAPAALSSLRSDQAMRLFVFGISAGLLFLVADGLLTALGETDSLPPVLAAWSAPLAFTALALTVLLYAEG